MSESESPIPTSSMRVVDVSGQSLAKISQLSSYIKAAKHNVAAVIADGNNLFTLQGIQLYSALIQLSVRDNSLVRMDSVVSLTNLVTLNLQNNSLTEIAGLESLVNLQWLCLSGNGIRALDGLSTNVRLSHVDLSDNCITELSNISMLAVLKTLLLHGNAISSLQRAGQLLPMSIETLSLAENEVEDLTQISSLTFLKLLTQLSLMNNPCVSITNTQMFDARPYVLYWCPQLNMLDGTEVTVQERTLSASLFPPNQPHPFSVGQHDLLVHYLTSISPLPSTQLFMSTSMSYNENQENMDPNDLSGLSLATLSSLTGMDELVKGAHSSDKLAQSELMQKLKALQLIEQMISTQEQLLSDRSGKDKQSSHSSMSVGSSSTAPLVHSQEKIVQSSLFSSLQPVLPTEEVHIFAPSFDGVDVKGHMVLSGEEIEEEKSASSMLSSCEGGHTKESTSSSFGQQKALTESKSEKTGEEHAEARTRRSHNTDQPGLRERKEEQLRLLNKKIAQRHSKLPRKSDSTGKSSQTSSTLSGSAASKKVTAGGSRRQDSLKTKPKRGDTKQKTFGRNKNESTCKKTQETIGSSGNTVLSSKSAPSLQSSRPVPSPNISSHSHTSLSPRPLTHATPSRSPKSKNQPVSSHKSYHKQSPLQPLVTETREASCFPSKDITDNTSFVFKSTSSSQQLVVPEKEMEAADNSGLLDSTSYLIPVDSDGDNTLVPDISAMDEGGLHDLSVSTSDKGKKRMDWPYEVDSLASSLTHAYGISTNSEFLSTLAAPHEEEVTASSCVELKERLSTLDETVKSGKKASKEENSFLVHPSLSHSSCPPSSTMTANEAATVIQAAWRRFYARKIDSEVARVREELNGISLETCITMLYSQLRGCREELAHQATVVQLQDETIQSLMKEVQMLLDWKVKLEVGERNKAAATIQKYWRGYRDRKRYPRSNYTLVPPSLGAVWSVCHSLIKQVEDMSVALSSFQDVCGTREKSQSKGIFEAHLPPAKDLHLTHFSSTCVLLHWTPALPSPSNPNGVLLQGYHVYVNGVQEGMVGPAKSKAYIEGLDPKTTYRITVRAAYNCGESVDSNPIIASLNASKGGQGGGASGMEGVESEARTNMDDSSLVQVDQSREVQCDGDTESGEVGPPSLLVDSESGEGREAAASEGRARHCYVGETEAPSQGEFLPGGSICQNNSEPQAGAILSPSTTYTLDRQEGESVGINSSFPSKPPGSMLMDSASPQQTPSETETDHLQSVDRREGESECKSQMPLGFDSDHLFRMVPKAHHITDETVSVMSNNTEEYLGGSSSRETVTHERSLTSMIFGAGESVGSASDTSLSESGSSSVLRDEKSELNSRDDQNIKIEEIQKSYLSQLPPQSRHPRYSQKAGETEDVDQLQCFQTTHIVRQSHDSTIGAGLLPSTVSTVPPTRFTPGSSALASHTPPDSDSAAPHPTAAAAPLLFNHGVAGASSKLISQPLHLPLSSVQVQGEEAEGPALLVTTTVLTHEPDSVAGEVGSSLKADTGSGVPNVASSRIKAKKEGEGRLKEMASEKVSVVAMGDDSSASRSQSRGSVKESSKWISSLSSLSSFVPGQACQVSHEQASTTAAAVHHINGRAPLGSQTSPGAFLQVAETTQLNLQTLLGSCTQTSQQSEEAQVGASGQKNHQIPEEVSEGTSRRDKNEGEKPFGENEESDTSNVMQISEEKDISNRGMNNKLNLEIPVGRRGVKVELPSQLGNDFDQLPPFEKLPSVVNKPDLTSDTEETKTSQSTGLVTEAAHPLLLSTSQLVPLTSSQQSVAVRAQRHYSTPTATVQESSDVGSSHGAAESSSNSSSSSAQLASLLLSQLETDLNTA